MSDAKRAFEEAERQIEKARESGATELRFDRADTHALERLPESVGQLSALEILDCDRTQINDLRPISGLTSLRTLRLMNTQVADLRPIAGFGALETLTLFGTKVSNFDVLDQLPNLTALDLAGTSFDALHKLSEMHELEWLYLERTQIRDLQPLAALTGLQQLDLRDTKAHDLRPLRGLTQLVENPKYTGVMFTGTEAAQADPRIAEIAEIEDNAERARALFAYLDTLEPLGKASTPALVGPILSDSLIEIERKADQFHAAALTDTPAKPLDRRHDDLVQSLSFIAGRIGGTETENRLGKEVCQNSKDYGQFVGQSPVNGRILWFLANGVRAVLTDPYKAEALDGFDRVQITGFLSESDALIQEYYPDAMRGARFETETPPDVLARDMPSQLLAARDILAAEDARGVFAPNVSDTLEMLIRREEGARRGYLTAASEEERAAAGAELQRVSVQSTALLGRINGRLTQWLKNTGAWAKVQVDHAKEHPVGTTAAVGGAAGAVYAVVQQLTPIFETLWKLIGNLPLPGF